MIKVCPHCQCEFECRNDNVLECDCVHVILSREALEYISSRYADCLCVDCLREINRMPELTEQCAKSGQYAETEQFVGSEQLAEPDRYDMEKTLITHNH